MATPKPGEIRCPTCHRSTPPAAFCTQCGSAIPSDARIRPRGMDRDELQERIRARRSGGDPYRRGASAGDEGVGYRRFEPEPEDEAARRAGPIDTPRRDLLAEAPAPPSRAAAAVAPAREATAPRGPDQRPDLTREREDEWPAPPAGPGEPYSPRSAPYLAPVEDYRGDPAPDEEFEYDEVGYAEGYEEWESEPRERRSAGAGALAILGFLALGVLALLGGAVLAGVFGGDSQTGGLGATPSAAASSAAIPSETAEPTAEPRESSAPTAEPRGSGDPVVFPDGFTAEVQPCLPGTADVDGCDSNGSVNSGALDIWVGFENGTENDVISAQIVRPDGSTVSTGTIELADIDCRGTCNGWTRFSISGLPPAAYDIRVTRNGELAGEATFAVS